MSVAGTHDSFTGAQDAPALAARVHKLLPGAFHVATADELISTLLGSCVAACIFDPTRGVGGMNHFLLPESGREESEPISSSNRYGVFAMESLINGLLARGAARTNLRVKLFGGGRVLPKLSDVGRRNIEFVHRFIATERLTVVAEDLGGDQPRKILMYPASGRVRVKKLPAIGVRDIVLRETRYLEEVDKPPAGTVEIFNASMPRRGKQRKA